MSAARVQRVLKIFKLETHYRCRWIARAQRHVCAVTKAERCVAGSLSLKSLEHVKSLSRWPEILNMASFEEALINMYRMCPVLYDMTLKDYKKRRWNWMFWRRLKMNCSMLRVVVFKVWELMNISVYIPTVWLVNHDTLCQRTWSGNQTNVIVVCFCSVCALERLKFDRVFVALSPAIFTLIVSLLAAWSLIAVSLSSSDSATAIVCLQL